jgi:hypothetical protein
MAHLYELIQRNVAGWWKDGYPTEGYPAVGEILDYALLPESGNLRYLRAAQLRALETYWYLHLVEGTPHIFDLYERYYPRPLDLLAALGLDRDEITDFVLNQGLDALWARIREGGEFVKAHKLESVHETLTLDYPSYILALAMVDVMMVDTAYDGEVFNVAVSDVPERKNDLVEGRYEVEAPEGKTTVAVKIIDMLGEEVLVTAEV